ncbi:MAG: glutathione S-transferase family protein [Cyanobacteria bacterium P01_A01_bin.114]
MSLKLIIGNKNYSSWSLRAWLFLTESQIPFEEIRIPLFTSQWQQITDYSPSARVPVLLDGDLAIWDTMAIYEHVLEQFPSAVGWPKDHKARAIARSISAEMHAGFLGIRDQLPQNIRARNPLTPSDLSTDTQKQIQRVQTMWTQCLETYGGPWLFGDFSIADVVYAPVALRFVTYQVSLEPAAQTFVETVQALPAIQQWAAASADEPEILAFIDELRPAQETELTL